MRGERLSLAGVWRGMSAPPRMPIRRRVGPRSGSAADHSAVPSCLPRHPSTNPKPAGSRTIFRKDIWRCGSNAFRRNANQPLRNRARASRKPSPRPDRPERAIDDAAEGGMTGRGLDRPGKWRHDGRRAARGVGRRLEPGDLPGGDCSRSLPRASAKFRKLCLNATCRNSVKKGGVLIGRRRGEPNHPSPGPRLAGSDGAGCGTAGRHSRRSTSARISLASKAMTLARSPDETVAIPTPATVQPIELSAPCRISGRIGRQRSISSWLIARLRRSHRHQSPPPSARQLGARAPGPRCWSDFYLRLRAPRSSTPQNTFNLPLTQQQIGDYLGLTVVHRQSHPALAARRAPSPMSTSIW